MFPDVGGVVCDEYRLIADDLYIALVCVIRERLPLLKKNELKELLCLNFVSQLLSSACKGHRIAKRNVRIPI
jgi:hypothetical protein